MDKTAIGSIYKGFKILDIKRINSKLYVLAICPFCGNQKWIRKDGIDTQNTKSCGCLQRKAQFTPIDISGKRFGNISVIKDTGKRNKYGCVIWLCKCEECKKEIEMTTTSIRDRKIKNCGCTLKNRHKSNGLQAANRINELSCIDGTSINSIRKKNKLLSTNTSGHTGVTYDKENSKWRAQIEFKGKHYNLGRYVDIKDAIAARKEAESALFGNFLQWFADAYPEKWKKIKEKEN